MSARRVETTRPATYADVVAAPENMVAELVDGVLYTSPRPASPHAMAASTLGGDLEPAFGRGRGGGPGGWLILFEPELHLAGDVLVPDLAGWRRERMPEMPDTAAFEIAPDWLCEVISPSTGGLDRGVKLPKYAAARVENVWFVDPATQTLEVLRLHGLRYHTLVAFSEDDKVRAEPFEAIEIALSDLWRR